MLYGIKENFTKLVPPDCTPLVIRKLMEDSFWQSDPNSRPDFKVIHAKLRFDMLKKGEEYVPSILPNLTWP